MKKGSSSVLLLDVNVLLALAWPNHQFHRAATGRLAQSKQRWATCAITQLGFIRLSSNPAAVGVPKSPWEAASLLALLTQDSRHVYWDSLPSPAAQVFMQGFERILGSKQVTDSYLLTLAVRNHARLLTFDSRLAAFVQAEVFVEVLAGG
jgi:toxin-antitoxin system PIN domain toxin